MQRRLALGAAFLTATALAGGLGASEVDVAGALASDQRCDFSGDGLPDSVTGIPGKTVNGKKGAGAIMVRYQFAGLEFPVMYTSNALAPATGNHFGASLACGDFDGDGFTDLAVGAPGYDQDAGAIVVFYSDGTSLGPSVAFTQDTSRGGFNVPGAKEADDHFGWSLAAGDFNNDGEDDLAIGAPDEDVTFGSKAYADSGAVVVLYGSGAHGLTANGVLFDLSDTESEWVLKNDGSRYGYSLAVGDFDGDTIDDLVVGAPGATVQDFHSKDKFHHVGLVHELRGHHHSGLAHHQYFWEGLFLGNDTPRAGDNFGFALATGDLDGNGRDDIAVGAPGDWAGLDLGCSDDPCETTTDGAGMVFTIKHTNNGSYAYTWYLQGVNGVAGVAENGDHFGYSVAIANFDAQHGADIAVGVPGENGTGAVTMIYSGGTSENLIQGAGGLPGGAEAGDWFGLALAVTDQDHDGVADLLIGSPSEDLKSIADTGTSMTVFGQLGGVGAGDLFDQSAPNGYQDWEPGATTHTWGSPIIELTWDFSGELFGFAVIG